MMAWRHINLQGEYDFTNTAANDFPFDIEKNISAKNRISFIVS